MNTLVPGSVLLAALVALGGGVAHAHEAVRCQSWLTALRKFVAHDRSTGYARRCAEGEHWGVDGEHLGRIDAPVTYNAYYAPTLKLKSLERLARERRASGRSTHALDLFGSAVFSREPDVFDTLTGARLVAYPRRRLSAVHRRVGHRSEVVGDLTQSSTWRRLDHDRRARGVPRYDYVFVRPIGALIEAGDHFIGDVRVAERRRAFFAFAHVFVNRAWRRLSADEGRLFLEVNAQIHNAPEFRIWLHAVAKLGIEFTFERAGGEFSHWHHVLQLVRRPNDPARLP